MENQEVQLLKDYSDTEKGAYLGAIASIASADHEASEQELQFLSALSKTAHLSSDSEQAVLSVAKDPSQINVQRCLDVLKASDLRYTFITDIMSFAKADGNLSGQEEELIKGMADYLGVNQQQYGVLKQFVEVADESAKKGEIVAPQAFAGNPQAAAPESGGGFDEMLKKVGIPSSGLMKGVLAIAAPILISQILRGGRRSGGMMGGMGSGMGGLLGGGLLGGLLGSVMGGGMNRGGLGGMMGGGSTMGSGGGLGSVLGGLGGLMGGSRRGMGGGILGGGLGSILGNVLGGRRAGW